MSPIEREELRIRARAMTEEEKIVVTHEMPDKVIINEVRRRLESMRLRNELLLGFVQKTMEAEGYGASGE